MSKTLAPTGLRPAGKIAGVNQGSFTQYPLTTNNTQALAIGDLVAFVNGSIVPVTASPTTTLSANTPIGVFVGVSYIDSLGHFHPSEVLMANAVTTGLTNILVFVQDDPNALFEVQADGTIPASALMSDAALLGFANTDVFTKTSRVVLDHTSLSKSSSAVSAVKIMKFVSDPTNASGDAFTRVIVKWNAGVHLFQNAGAE
jgi:hypothetical protein